MSCTREWKGRGCLLSAPGRREFRLWAYLCAALVVGCVGTISDDDDDDDDGGGPSPFGGGSEPGAPDEDSGGEPDAECDPSRAESLVIGVGSGSEFTPLESGDSVGLDVAPQGGFGVSVRAKTMGLVTDALVEVTLATAIDGEVSDVSVQDGLLYCQDNGTGLIWGMVAGFDPDVYTTSDDLWALNGQVVDLVVTATDIEGDSASASIDVMISMGGCCCAN